MIYNVLIDADAKVYVCCNAPEAKTYAEQGCTVFLNGKEVSTDEINESDGVVTVQVASAETTTQGV